MNITSSHLFCILLDGTYCKEGWLGFNGNCYKQVEDYSTTVFSEAEEKCADEYDATVMSILDEGHGWMERWSYKFLNMMATSEIIYLFYFMYYLA